MATRKTNIFGEEPPQGELFHYTSAEGLKGIIERSTLWATNIEYMNDTTEFEHGKELIESVMVENRKNAGTGKQAFLEALFRGPSVFQPEDVFVASLSKEGDLLSQWRGYTPPGLGFNVGFDPLALSQASCTQHGMQLVRCLYDRTKKVELAQSLLEEGPDIGDHERRRQQSDEAEEVSLSRSVIGFKSRSTFAASAMKDPTFAEEREWRLLGLCLDRSRLRFRAGKSSLVPYIEIKWSLEGEAAASPLRSVTIGPCPNPELSKRSVRRFIQACGLQGVSVRTSEIPFRSW